METVSTIKDGLWVWVRSVETKEEVGTLITDILGKAGVFKVHHKQIRQK